MSYLYNGDFLSVEIFRCYDLTDGLDLGTAGVLFIRLCDEGNEGNTAMHNTDEMQRKIERTQNLINSETHETFQAMRISWSKARKEYSYIVNRSLVKLIAEDECGQNRVCCDFIWPIVPPRHSQLSNGPRFAARSDY